MTISQFFEMLEAPLVCFRRSWGAYRAEDNVLFLRVWQDECTSIDKKRCVRILNAESTGDSFGRKERREHIQAIETGTPVYLIMCVAKDPGAVPRSIHRFNRDELFIGGKVHTLDGNVWLELVGRIKTSVLKTPEALLESK